MQTMTKTRAKVAPTRSLSLARPVGVTNTHRQPDERQPTNLIGCRGTFATLLLLRTNTLTQT